MISAMKHPAPLMPENCQQAMAGNGIGPLLREGYNRLRTPGKR
jgi:hypothetical protein